MSAKENEFCLEVELLETFRLRSEPPAPRTFVGGLRNRLKQGGTRVRQDWAGTAIVQAKWDETVNKAILVRMGLRDISGLIYTINYDLIVNWNKGYRELKLMPNSPVRLLCELSTTKRNMEYRRIDVWNTCV